MAKNKQQQKKKERERRIAKAKLAAAEKRRAEEKENKEVKKSAGSRMKFISSSVKNRGQAAKTNKKTFTQRRTGG